ncbi:MAG: hypothetical protein AAGC84_04955, partial [Pseudomonas sp.]
PDSASVSEVALGLGPQATVPTGVPGTAVRAACHLGHAPSAGAVNDIRALRPGSVVPLAPVSSADFSTSGPIGKAATEVPLAFHCVARAASEVTVSFDATFPFNAGLEGVGMPAPNSDIGVQILLEGKPVQLGTNSPPLRWRFQPSSRYPEELPGRSVQGRFCNADCGAQTSLSDPHWLEGDGGTGSNLAIESTITFRYFQTTQRRPRPGAFSVPFTLTMEWN